MLEYVDDFGGHLTIVFRSVKHASGATSVTGPLGAVLTRLAAEGKVTILKHP